MARGEREVKVTVLGEDRGAKKTLKDLGDEADHTDGRLSKLGSGIGSFAKTAAAGFAIVGTAAVAGMASAISAGSDLQETISKSREIFGQQAGAMERWASTAASSFGQSKQEALDAAATFGNLFSQLGISGMQVSHLSAKLVELSSDFASFHNANPADVVDAMTAAFRGEYDAVQKYVPTINAAAVEQKALEMGLAGSTKELTAQHKALATEKLLMEGAGKAMGDFDRTSDGLANKTRIATAKFKDFQANIGTALIPVALKGMDALERLGKGVKGVFDIFAKGDFTGGLGVEEDSPIVDLLFRIREAGVELVDSVRENWPKIKKTITDVVQGVVSFIQTNWPKIQKTITETMETVMSVVKGVLTVVKTIWDNFGSQIIAVVQTAWDFISRVINDALQVIQGIVKVVTGLIKGDWGMVWDGIKQIVAAAWDAIKAAISFALGLIREIVSAGWELVKGIFTGAWDGIKTAVREGAAFIVDKMLAAFEWIIKGAATAFGWIPGIGPKLREAAQQFEQWRNDINSSIRGIVSSKTITLFLQTNDRNLGTAGDPRYAATGGLITRTGIARFGTGDLVPGSGNGDTVPAWLTPGEFVVRKAAVNSVGLGTLRKINAMAGGGLVGGGSGASGDGGSLVVQLVLDGRVLTEKIVDNILVMKRRDPGLLG